MLKTLTLTCDHCYVVDDEQDSIEEAFDVGWWVLKGPERYLGGDGERVYCCQECLVADL